MHNREYEAQLQHITPRFAALTTVEPPAPRETGYTMMERIQLFLSVFDSHPDWRRTSQQAECHDTYLRACAPSIFFNSWEAERANVISLMQWPQNMKQEVGVGMPRRFGKTVSTSMFAAAYALAVKGRRIAIFSAGQRQSGDLLKHVKKFFQIIVETLDPELVPSYKIIKNSSENFHIEFADGSVTEVNSFPCSIQIRYPFFTFPLLAHERSCQLSLVCEDHNTCLFFPFPPPWMFLRESRNRFLHTKRVSQTQILRGFWCRTTTRARYSV